MSQSVEAHSWVHERRAHALPLGQVASWGLFGSFTYAACQWAMLVVLAKLGSTEMLGQFALGFAIAAPVFLLTSLSLREVLSTDARDAHAFGDYLALRVIGVFAGLLAIGAVTCVVGYRWETKLVILLVGGVKAIEAVSDVLYGLMQKHERMDLIAGSIVLRGLLSVVALGAGVYLSGSLVWGLVLVSAAWALVLITYDFPRGARLLESNVRPRWTRADLARLAWLSLPLGITAMMISLRATIPRYFVERYRGEQELGVFVAMAYLMIVGGTAVNALGQSASARLATYYAEGDRASARHLLSGLVGVGLVLGAVGVAVAFLWGGEVLTVLYRPEYAEHVEAFVLIMGAAAISYVASALGFAVTAARCFRAQTVLFAGVTAVALLACATLIPGRGLVGAGQASVVTWIANLLGIGALHLYALRHPTKSVTGDRHLDAREAEQ